MDNEPQTFGQRLQCVIDVLNLKQDAAAELVGTSQGSMSRWLADLQKPTMPTGRYVAARLGVNFDWLYYGRTDGHDNPIRVAREAAGLSIKELAAKIKRSVGRLQAIENGAQASESLLRELAQALPSFSAEAAMETSEHPNIVRDDRMEGTLGTAPMPGANGCLVPVFSFAQAGQYALTSTDEAWSGEAMFAHGVKRPSDGFWLRIEGDSMEPMIREKDQVLVRLDKDPIRGKPVVVKTTRGEVFCKIWLGIRDGSVTLKSSNPAHDDIVMSAEDIAFVYPVGEVRHVLL